MDDPRHWPPQSRDFPTYPFLAFLGLSSLWLIWALRFPATGWDFTHFYIAARLPVRALYSRPAVVDFGEKSLAPLAFTIMPPMYDRLFSHWCSSRLRYCRIGVRTGCGPRSVSRLFDGGGIECRGV